MRGICLFIGFQTIYWPATEPRTISNNSNNEKNAKDNAHFEHRILFSAHAASARA